MIFKAHEFRKTVRERLEELREARAVNERQRRRRELLESLLQELPDAELTRIRERHWSRLETEEYEGWGKYLDCAYWVDHNIDVAERLGLAGAPPMTILDIGSGPGAFELVGSHLGHRVVSLDIENPLLDEIALAMGIKRRMVHIEPETPLPDLGAKFDLVTTESTMFNILPPGGQERFWSLGQWRFFISDLINNHLQYPGRIHFMLNCENRNGQQVINTQLLDYCAANGAEVLYKGGGHIDWRLPAPPSGLDLAFR